MIKKQFLIDLKKLVSIDCGSHYIKGINLVADIICQHFKEMDNHWYETRENISAECGPILYFSNKRDQKPFDITFLCHLDTTYQTGTCKAHPPYQHDDRYYGPGTSDMKAGCLSVIYALKYLDIETLNKLSICVCFTSDEELSAKYSYPYIESLAKRSRCVFVPEAAEPNGDLITSRYGKSVISIQFLTKKEIDNQETSSAIILLGQWIEKINQLSQKDNQNYLKITKIKNNHHTFTQSTEMMLIHRFTSNNKGDEFISKIQQLAKEADTQELKVTVTRLAGRPAFLPNKNTNKILKLIQEAAIETNISVGFSNNISATDANIAASCNTIVIDGFGPCGGGYHNVKEEYILIPSIIPRIELLQKTIKKIASLH